MFSLQPFVHRILLVQLEFVLFHLLVGFDLNVDKIDSSISLFVLDLPIVECDHPAAVQTLSVWHPLGSSIEGSLH